MSDRWIGFAALGDKLVPKGTSAAIGTKAFGQPFLEEPGGESMGAGSVSVKGSDSLKATKLLFVPRVPGREGLGERRREEASMRRGAILHGKRIRSNGYFGAFASLAGRGRHVAIAGTAYKALSVNTCMGDKYAFQKGTCGSTAQASWPSFVTLDSPDSVDQSAASS